MTWWLDLLFAAVAASIIFLLLVLFELRVTVRYKLARAYETDAPGFTTMLAGLTNSASAPYEQIALYDDVDAIYAAMLADIRQATRSITLETYLFWSGKIADDFIAALAERAAAGVRVRVLLDADGSRFLSRRDVKRWRAAGCEVRFFRPLQWYRPAQYNHRTHRKILVVDGRIGYTGGIGVADIWLGPPPWLETMVRLEGGVVTLLQGAFFQDWLIARGPLDLGEAFFPAPAQAGPAKAGPAKAMVTCSAPIWGDSAIRLLYFGAITGATERLWLASPYFLPNWDTTAALATAAARGVDVRLVLPGPMNDKRLPYWASRRLYGQLLLAGVRIFEYQPAMMHAKAMTIDGRWSTLGSTNFDPRSFFLNSELNVSIDDPAFAGEMEAFFERAVARSREITLADWQGRGPLERLGGLIGLMLKDQI